MSSTPVKIVFSGNEEAKIKEILENTDISENIKKRAYAVLLLSEGEHSLRQIADEVCYKSASSVYKIYKKFKENGIDSLFNLDKSIKNKDLNGNHLLKIKNLNMSLTTVYKYVKKLLELDPDYSKIIDYNSRGIVKSDNIENGNGDTKISITISNNDVVFTKSTNIKLGFNKNNCINSINDLINRTSIFERNLRQVFCIFFKLLLVLFINMMFSCNSEKRRMVKIDTLLGTVKVNLPKSLTTSLPPNQHLQTDDYQDVTALAVQNTSFRNASSILNAALERPPNDQISYRTLCDRSLRLGEDLIEKQKKEASKIINEANIQFDQNQAVYINDEMSKNRNTSEKRSIETSNKNIIYVASKDNEKNKNENKINTDKNYECEVEVNPQKTVYISADDILVKHQNEERKVNGKSAKKSTSYVCNSVGVIYTVGGKILLVAETIYYLFFYIFALLIKNGILYKQIVFFYDGQQSVLNSFKKFFWWKRDTIIILDWYHLSKKVIEFISMGIKGSSKFKDEKNKIKKAIKTMLWYGNVVGAKDFISNIPSHLINDQNKLNNLTEYLKKHESEIICYALRKALGLKNGSSMVESANNELVARRQKRKGACWSYGGSWSMAANICRRKNKIF